MGDVSYLNTYKHEFKPSVAWHKCQVTHTDKYKMYLYQKLLAINPSNEALGCRNYSCPIHRKELQELHDNIVGCIKLASSNCLPHISDRKNKNGRKVVPGWNEHVKEHVNNAKDWNDIWINQGKPRSGDIARMRRVTKLRYHYAVTKVKNDNVRLRNERMGEAIANNNDRMLWDEVRKMTKFKDELPSMMDGHTGTDEISKIFSDKYETLYNTVSYNKHDMDKLKKEIDSNIAKECPNGLVQSNNRHSITVKELKKYVNMLKLGK